MDRKRVYHPETNEPFDPPAAKAEKLVLEHGWLQQPIDPDAVPAVQDIPRERGSRSRRPAAAEAFVEVPEEPVEVVPDPWRRSAQEVED